ncbi:MAG: OPT family oligopeptide transporter [Phycisphaerae bacterium]
MREFSPLAIILGVVIGSLLAAANAFVGLKVGMTISASIPAAVMSLLIMRTLLKRGTLLEHNMVQTVGSAGESVAAGMIFTMPAFFIMGQSPEYLAMVMWAAIGGLLGVCFMVPLRRVLIVKEHGVLPFPEGVACAEVLRSGERGGEGAKSVLWGAVVGGAYYVINALGFWRETGVVLIRRLRTQAELDSSPALLGVGFILGPRVAAYMLSGAILGWFVLIPAIALFGADAQVPVFPSTTTIISEMSPVDMWEDYIRYVGAGAVAIAGLLALLKSFPTIFASFWHVLAGVFSRDKQRGQPADKDFPFVLLIPVIVGLGYAMWRFPQVMVGHVGTVAVIVFAFFFVTVSSRLVGIVGSSSNPVSGMTIATILAAALAFRYFVVGDVAALPADELTIMKVRCLAAGAIVCIAIAVAGDCSQDLKTGFLLKATPYKQQLGEMVGVLTSVFVLSGILILLHATFGFGEATAEHPFPLLAPQANIMKILVDGVLGGSVPWTLILIGAAGAVIVEMLGLPALPFAVGLYLPLGLSTPIMAGGVVRWVIERRGRRQREHNRGILCASGLVAGYGLAGVALAGVLALMVWLWHDPHWVNPVSGVEEAVSYGHFVPWLWANLGFLPIKWGLSSAWWDALPFFPFLILVVWLWWCARSRHASDTPPTEVAAPVGHGPITSPADAAGGPEEPSEAGSTDAAYQADVPPADVAEGTTDEMQATSWLDEATIPAAPTTKLSPLPPIPQLPRSLRSPAGRGSEQTPGEEPEEPAGSEADEADAVERFEPPARAPDEDASAADMDDETSR